MINLKIKVWRNCTTDSKEKFIIFQTSKVLIRLKNIPSYEEVLIIKTKILKSKNKHLNIFNLRGYVLMCIKHYSYLLCLHAFSQ